MPTRCHSRDEIVLAWARRHYPDADRTFTQFRNYYEREMVKEVERKTSMAAICCQEALTGGRNGRLKHEGRPVRYTGRPCGAK